MTISGGCAPQFRQRPKKGQGQPSVKLATYAGKRLAVDASSLGSADGQKNPLYPAFINANHPYPGTVPPRGRRLGTFPQTCRRCAPPVTSVRPTSFASQRTQASFTFQIRGFGWSRCKQHGTFMFASPRDARERNGRQMHGNGARRYGEGRAWSPRRFYGPLARCRQKRKRKKTRWRRRRGRRDLRNGCRYSLRP